MHKVLPATHTHTHHLHTTYPHTHTQLTHTQLNHTQLTHTHTHHLPTRHLLTHTTYSHTHTHHLPTRNLLTHHLLTHNLHTHTQLMMITASCFRLACTVASSRIAIKHEKSDTCTRMRASIAHEKGLKIATGICAVRLTAARWSMAGLVNQQVQSNHQLVYKSWVTGPQTTRRWTPKSIKGSKALAFPNKEAQ